MLGKTAICLFHCFLLMVSQSCSQKDKSSAQATNALIHETSPYLLQHAHNPVDWYPWGTTALQKAKKENKLLIVSIGYAACHWCHVMERECFEDTAVASAMNKDYISIKVDREERPDIDQVYMQAAQLMNGRAGWPLNIIALPDGRPVFSGTYFSKDDWLIVLKRLASLYKERPRRLQNIAQRVTQGIRSAEVLIPSGKDMDFSKEMIEAYYRQVRSQLDLENGGTLGAPKFPMPANQQFLLQYFYYTRHEEAKAALLTTLDKIASGGIYDQLGGGFARYATDEKWRVPHFEKMLYDNAQLVSLYAKAYQLTKNPDYKKVVYETLHFIRQALTSPEGAFYASLNADSEGEEGKYYTWTADEIDLLLETDTDLLKEYYQISDEGNWEAGKNILYVSTVDSVFAPAHGLTLPAWQSILGKAKGKLLAARNKRIKPSLDDKVLTSWNALMMTGYIDAYRAFGEQAFLEAALRNANFLKDRVINDHEGLTRSYKNGKTSVAGFLDDYGYVISAFISLYQATFDETWLYEAKALMEYALAHFLDQENHLFYYTSQQGDIILRHKEIADDVIPASNSEMAKNLYLLGIYFDQKDYMEQARKMLVQVKNRILQYPLHHGNWALVLNYFIFEPYEVAIIGKNFKEKRQSLDNYYFPNIILSGGNTEGSLPLLKHKMVEGQTTIYVCQHKVCQLPVTVVEDALAQIKQK